MYENRLLFFYRNFTITARRFIQAYIFLKVFRERRDTLEEHKNLLDRRFFSLSLSLSRERERKESIRIQVISSYILISVMYLIRVSCSASPLTHSSNQFTSPTVDNLTIHNRQQFISSTNLNSDDLSIHHRQQQHNQSTPYLSSQVRENPSPTFKSSYKPQQQIDRHSNVGSDSGIVITNVHPTIDDNPLIERKLTDLVQQLGKQLETDAQKLSEKLEFKLKNLEHMIHQQTYIIRRQDEVIERLKGKILKIENERDHFRERLSVHEQREHDEKRPPRT